MRGLKPLRTVGSPGVKKLGVQVLGSFGECKDPEAIGSARAGSSWKSRADSPWSVGAGSPRAGSEGAGRSWECGGWVLWSKLRAQ